MKNWKLLLAGLALVLGVGVALVGLPTLQDRLDAIGPEAEKKLASREVQIDPGELLDLIYHANFGVRILDLRPETDYNLFHILDAQRVTLDRMRDPAWVKSLPAQTAFVLVGNGEERAAEAFKLMSAWKVPNLYILEGGVNHWLEVYGKNRLTDKTGVCKGVECRRYRFEAALGDRHPESDPGVGHGPARTYTKKVKPIGRIVRKAGGCG